jgi:hypothetical protein
MLNKNSSRILWCSLLLGICFDILFWKKSPGISFFIFTALLTIACFVLGFWNDQKPAVMTWVLAWMALLFSAMTFIRQEPFTTFIIRSGHFLQYGIAGIDLLERSLVAVQSADTVTGMGRYSARCWLAGAPSGGIARKSDNNGRFQIRRAPKKEEFSIWAVVRGLLLAFPIVFFLA